MTTTLAAGATNEEAIAARMAAQIAALGAGDIVPMQDKKTRRHNKRKEPRAVGTGASTLTRSNMARTQGSSGRQRTAGPDS